LFQSAKGNPARDRSPFDPWLFNLPEWLSKNFSSFYHGDEELSNFLTLCFGSLLIFNDLFYMIRLDDIKHHCKVVTALKRTAEVQREIDIGYPDIEKETIEF